MKEEKKYKIVHIIIIVLTFILPVIGIFNPNLWFDELYSVGLCNQNIGDLLSYAIADVHPVLYYVLLKIFISIFGKNLIVFRLFSVIPIAILSIFSYTHISKKFGYKVGAFFAFILLFLPITFHYGTQIRMYSWAMLFIAVTAYYAYIAINENYSRKNWITFTIFSILSAYTHYFALFTVGIINILILIHITRNKKDLLNKWLIFGTIQIFAYIPGLIVFIQQSLVVTRGFWITVTYPNIFMEIIEFLFKDSIKSGLPSILAMFIFIYMILRVHKEYLINKNEIKSVTNALLVCGLVILITLIESFFRPIFIPRYMIPMCSLAIFAFATILARENRKWIKIIICTGLIGVSLWNGVSYCQISYDVKNREPWDYIKNEIHDGDIILYKEVVQVGMAVYELKDNIQYFYNKDNWPVEVAYGAFKPQMKVIQNLDEIKDYEGRIWVIDSYQDEMYNYVDEIEETAVLLDKKEFYHPYSESKIVISLFEKHD